MRFGGISDVVPGRVVKQMHSALFFVWARLVRSITFVDVFCSTVFHIVVLCSVVVFLARFQQRCRARLPQEARNPVLNPILDGANGASDALSHRRLASLGEPWGWRREVQRARARAGLRRLVSHAGAGRAGAEAASPLEYWKHLPEVALTP